MCMHVLTDLLTLVTCPDNVVWFQNSNPKQTGAFQIEIGMEYRAQWCMESRHIETSVDKVPQTLLVVLHPVVGLMPGCW